MIPTPQTDLGRQPPKIRVALWDHARFALIVLVVVGHLLTTLRMHDDVAYALYAYIYLFHMPAMILLSGVFSKPEVTPKAITSTWQLLITWLIWEGIWAVIHLVFGGKWLKTNWLVAPAWTLWFLVSLVTMRILLPYIAKLKHPLIFSIVVALVAGFAPAIGSNFSAARTLSFLPLFVLGWLAKDRGWFDREPFMRPSRLIKSLAWVALAGTLAVIVFWPNLKNEWRIDKWLTWRDGYSTLFDTAAPFGWEPATMLTGVSGMGVRLGLLLIAAGLTVAVLLVVPRKNTRFTGWGSRTLYVYLLHGPIIMALRASGVIDEFGALGLTGIALLILLGITIASLLSTKLVSRIFRPVIEPRMTWPFRRET